MQTQTVKVQINSYDECPKGAAEQERKIKDRIDTSVQVNQDRNTVSYLKIEFISQPSADTYRSKQNSEENDEEE